MSGEDKNTASENAIGWFILSIVLFCLLLLFWYFNEYQVKNAVRWFRWAEMWLISHFVDDQYTIIWQGKEFNFNAIMNSTAELPARRLSAEIMAIISATAMLPLKYIYMAALGVMAMWAIMFGPGTQYRRKLDLNGLIFAQARTFPVISPFIKFDPGQQKPRPPGSPVPAELPPFAEALGPEEWISYNQIPVPDGHLDEQAAYVALARQLGPRWRGAMKLPPYKQVLLASFCLKAARKRNDADDLLGRIARCWSHDKGLQLKKDKKLLSDARRVLRSRDLAGATLANCNQHAFDTTAMLQALLTARNEGGVLAPAQFVWLRAYDRTLWYPLNNLGRHAFHPEAMGAMAHFKAERMTQRPIPRPKVDSAIKSMAEYMASPRARPLPELDYSNAKKKRGIKKPKSVKAPPKKKKK